MRQFNYEKEADRIGRWITETVRHAKAKGVVLGLSGGIDSSVTASLCAKHMSGEQEVLGILMPEDYTPPEDIKDAAELGERLKIETRLHSIHAIMESFRWMLPHPQDHLTLGNVRARVRMTILYYYANQKNLLVCGTGDQSEYVLGYFTKYGDGGADIFPIGHLYKTEIRKMAQFLGLPMRIIEKPSSPQLWAGQKATDELGAPYEEIDPMLMFYFNDYFSMRSKPQDEDIMQDLLKKPMFRELLARNVATDHKRHLPLTVPPGFV